jgi:hypothetical protein
MTTQINGIGIWGSGPGAGKSTVAKIIKKFCPELEIKPFAEPIKKMVRLLLLIHGYSPDQAQFYLYDPFGKETPLDLIAGKPTSRKLMQTLGTEWGREIISQEIWANAWRQNCFLTNFIADDVRFHAEINAVRSLQGKIWAVTGPVYLKPTHSSESFTLSDFKPDYVIQNNGTLCQLEMQVKVGLGL